MICYTFMIPEIISAGASTNSTYTVSHLMTDGENQTKQ